MMEDINAAYVQLKQKQFDEQMKKPISDLYIKYENYHKAMMQEIVKGIGRLK